MSRAQSLPPLLGRDAPHGLTCGLRVVERDHTSPDDLSLLMPFAGEEEDVAGPQLRDGGGDRRRPVADFLRTRTGRQDSPSNRGGIFGPRIVVRDDHLVGMLGGNATHDWALSGTAIPAAHQAPSPTDPRARP